MATRQGHEESGSSVSSIGQQPEDSGCFSYAIGWRLEGAYGCLSSKRQNLSPNSQNLSSVELANDNKVQLRLRTYKTWKGKIPAFQLATAGFLYTGIGDKVQCGSCGIRLYNWQVSDDPLHTHKKYAPHCEFMLTGFPEVKAQRQPTKPFAIKYPHYSSYQSRLESFEDWPLTCVAQKPEMMARSGFYYFGSADRARCFHCGITFRDWATDDYPPSTHKQWSEHCPFVQTLDVTSMTNEIKKWERMEEMRKKYDCNTILRASDTDKTVRAGNDFTLKADISQLPSSKADNSRPLSLKGDDSIQPPPLTSKSPAFIALVEMGYLRKDIYKAAEVRRNEGCLNPDATSLLSVILDLELSC